MVLSLTRCHRTASPVPWRQGLLVAATVIAWLLLAGFIASLYVGHSPGPYGTCAGRNGRAVACTLLHR